MEPNGDLKDTKNQDSPKTWWGLLGEPEVKEADNLKTPEVAQNQQQALPRRPKKKQNQGSGSGIFMPS